MFLSKLKSLATLSLVRRNVANAAAEGEKCSDDSVLKGVGTFPAWTGPPCKGTCGSLAREALIEIPRAAYSHSLQGTNQQRADLVH